jgi:hypothetical protein
MEHFHQQKVQVGNLSMEITRQVTSTVHTAPQGVTRVVTVKTRLVIAARSQNDVVPQGFDPSLLHGLLAKEASFH